MMVLIDRKFNEEQLLLETFFQECILSEIFAKSNLGGGEGGEGGV